MDSEKKSTLNIRLHLYDTDLPVTIPRAEEEYYRKAAKRITDTINAYANRFKGKWNDKNITYMAMTEIALKLEQERLRTDPTPVYDVLAKLTKEIDEALAE